MRKKNINPHSKINNKIKKTKVAAKQMGSLEKLRRMATVIQDSNDAITFQDLDGNILAWNRGAEKMYGYSQLEALSMNIVDTVPKEYQEEAREFLASLKRGELVPNLETKRKTKDGRILDVWLANTKLTDDKGRLTGIATTERDITERKQSEVKLKEKFLELNFLREGQIALSEKMRGEQIISLLGQNILSHLVPFINAQIGALYVVTDDKKLQRVSGYALSKIEHAIQDIEFGEGLIGQVAKEKKTLVIDKVPKDYFNKIKSALGETPPRSLLICPILYDNEVTGVIELGSMQPFTEHQKVFLNHVSENIGIAINTSDVRKKVEIQNEALNKAQVLLEEKANEVQRASRYKTEFLANMSHELRTPLNSSLILSQLLMDNAKKNLTEEQIQFATSINSSGKDLLNLINDVLDLSKVEAGKLDIVVEKVVAAKVIEGLKQTFQSLAAEKKLIFEVSQVEDIPKFFFTDRQRLDQILKNLVSNAIKFTKNGFVKIKLYNYSEGNIAFEVSDSGIGIPKEQQHIIFEAFRQADGTTNRKYGGTGLGLSISRDLAKLLGGFIKVTSSPGEGSSFTLVLPVVFDESLILSNSNIESIPKKNEISYGQFEKYLPLPFEDDRFDLSESDRTILIIEDDVKFAKILMDLAHEFKYKCIVGQGADEGFDLAIKYNPNAIILDIKLPDHLGLTTLDRLKGNAKTRHMPVFAISSEDYQKTVLRMGAIGFILKPAKHEEIKNIFLKLESVFAKNNSKVLIISNKEKQRKNISNLICNEGIGCTFVSFVKEAAFEIKKNVFHCVIFVLENEDLSGIEFLEQLNLENNNIFPPIIIYSHNDFSEKQKNVLKRLSKSVFLKLVVTSEALFSEVASILHLIESTMSDKQLEMVRATRSKEHGFEGKKILLVDDDIRNIFALTSALEQQGATIYVGRNGQEALDKLNEEPLIDLVLMDIMMPEMDGYEATRRIRLQKRFSKLPIIAVTAKAMKDDQEKCIQAGTNDYVSKPVDVEKLQSLIRVWIQ